MGFANDAGSSTATIQRSMDCHTVKKRRKTPAAQLNVEEVTYWSRNSDRMVQRRTRSCGPVHEGVINE